MTANFTIPHVDVVEYDPFSGPQITYIAPTTESQLEIWTACLLGSDDANRAYNESISLRLNGSFHKAAFEQAVQELTRRHDALRSVFSADGQHICVQEQMANILHYQDFSTEPPSSLDQLVDMYCRQDALYVFDLINGPLFKPSLLKLSEQEHCFILTAHHIVCDGWSMGILIQDISALYSALAQNKRPALPEAMPFSQYADEQIAFNKSVEHEQIVDYWVSQYNEHVPVVELPIDFPRPALRTYKGSRLDYPVDRELVSKVKKMGTQAGCSFVTTLLAAFDVLIHQLTGQEVITVGIPTAGQSLAQNHRLVGHCVNLLPIRSILTEELSFLDFLKLCKKRTLDAYDHQQLTFGSLLKQLSVARNVSRVPLVPVIFNIDLNMDDGVSFWGLEHQLSSNPKEYGGFELFLNASGSEKALTFEWFYNTQLFKSETIDGIMLTFERLLKALVANPSMIINKNPYSGHTASDSSFFQHLSPQPEKPAVSQGTDETIVDLFAQQVQKTPDNVALVFENTTLTYRQLDEKANRLAHYLIGREIQPDTLVPLCFQRSPDMIVAILGVLKAGGAYLPIDPDYPQERIDYMLTDSGSKFMLTHSQVGTLWMTSQPLAELIRIDIDREIIDAESGQAPQPALKAHHLAYAIYTSGSTGQPKGVLIEHKSLVNFITNQSNEFSIDEFDCILQTSTYTFDPSIEQIFLALTTGARLVLIKKETLIDPNELTRIINEQGITHLHATPSLLKQLIPGQYSTLKRVISGGEVCPPDLARNWSQWVQFYNKYGPTETTISSLQYLYTPANLPLKSIPIGKPVANTYIYICNEQGKPLPIGVAGELYIGGAGLARGYRNKPALTTDKFVANPFGQLPDERLYKTGDLGKWLPDGNIEYMGRIDEQVKIRGYRIELNEIENVLQQHSGVKYCAVVAVDDDIVQDKRLVGYIVPEGKLNRKAIRDFMQAKLPGYMVPRTLVELNEIPLTSNGKINKKALPEPVVAESEEDVDYVGPRTDVEKLVADIWLECLKLDKINVFDNFFELGGHSLIAIQVMNRLEKKTGKILPLSTLFEYPTVEKLSLMLQMDGRSISWDSLVPIKPHGTKMPLYIVHGSGLHVLLFNTLAMNMDPDQPIYGLQAKGINSEDEPFESIEEIAAYYIDAIIVKNADGPYALAGYSFGGRIAYEMSRQLMKMGKEVKLLIMFDTYAHQSNYFDPWMSKVWNNSMSFVKERMYLLTMLKRSPLETVKSKQESAKRKINQLYRRVRYNEDPLEVFYGNYYKVHTANEIAYHKYRLVPQEVRIELFRARKRNHYLEDSEFYGWKQFALKGINIHEVPGDHFNLFSPPNDKELARTLQRVLDDC